MTSPAAALEFFVSEASGYIDGLDTLFSSAGPAGPDREAFVRLARALRGNSTMYRQPAISRVASALERVARALRDGAVTWNPRLGGALVAAVDDLRILLRNVRSWGPGDDHRAQARAAELEMMAPSAGHAPPVARPEAGRDFLAAKAREVATAIDRVVTAPGDRAALASLLRSVRGLNGIATLREHAALPEVGGTVERSAQAAELGGSVLRPAEVALLRAAAAVLHRAAGEIGAGRRLDPSGPELREYARAAGASSDAERPERELVVPIARLFHDDAGPHLLREATEPPTTAGARFRLDAVTHAEHLRRLLADGRDALDPASRERASREIRRELDALATMAEGYGESGVARFLATWRAGATALDRAAIETVDAVLALLADPATPRSALERAIDRVSGDAPPMPAPTRAAPPRPVEAPAARPTPGPVDAVAEPGAPRPRAYTPSGRELRAFLDQPISEIRRLEQRPLTPPVTLPQEHIVPIGDLLYRGRGALVRARELRDAIRGGRQPATPETLEELFDLLDLAAAE